MLRWHHHASAAMAEAMQLELPPAQLRLSLAAM